MKVKISLGLELHMRNLENLTIQKQTVLCDKKTRKVKCLGIHVGKVRKHYDSIMIRLGNCLGVDSSGTLTRETNNQLGTHNLEMLDHPSETWESFDRQD